MREYVPTPVPQDAKELSHFLSDELALLAATLSQPDFLAPTLLNSWVNYAGGFAPAGFYKDGLGRVHFKGLIKDGTATSGTNLFAVPKGFRPGAQLVFPIISNGALGRLDVYPNGNVAIIAGSNVYLSLNGISYAAEL